MFFGRTPGGCRRNPLVTSFEPRDGRVKTFPFLGDRRPWITFLPLFASVLLATSMAAAAKPPIDEVVGKMQDFYRTTKDLRGKFKQVYTDVLYERRRTSHGRLYVKKPGMMRWDYLKPEKKSFIADGKELWMWEPEDKQAFRNPLNTDTLSTGLTFLLGAGDLKQEFVVSYAGKKDLQIGAPEDLVLKLTPRKPTAQYEFLLLAVNPRSFTVSETMILSKHSRNHFVFLEIQQNTGLKQDRFHFVAPAGVRVIDAKSLKR